MATQQDLYFAFGSNLCSERLQKSIPDLKNPDSLFGLGKVEGRRLHFARVSKTWKGGSATMKPDENSFVWGALWKVTTDDIKALDIQEGVHNGIYCRVRSPEDITVVDINGKTVNCFTYLMNDKFEESLPSPHYLHVIRSGASQINLPKSYQDEILSKILTNNYTGSVGVHLSILPNGCIEGRS